MTNDNKNLRLIDLCARLPYEVRVKELEAIKELELYLTSIYHDTVQVETMTGGRMACSIEAIKPYLRSLSSMTEEERLVYEQRFHDVGRSIDAIDADDIVSHIDWLNAHHFDYRGLITMGLALEAPVGMYKNK